MISNTVTVYFRSQRETLHKNLALKAIVNLKYI